MPGHFAVPCCEYDDPYLYHIPKLKMELFYAFSLMTTLVKECHWVQSRFGLAFAGGNPGFSGNWSERVGAGFELTCRLQLIH
jgi:hypothetical protein